MKTRGEALVEEKAWLRNHHHHQREVQEAKGDWRCVVCTLPFGTCGHDKSWQYRREKQGAVQVLKPVRRCGLQDLDGPKGAMKGVLRDAFPKMCYLPQERLVSKKIEGQATAWERNLATKESYHPGADRLSGRAFHSAVALGQDRLVLFGGIAFERLTGGDAEFFPYATALAQCGGNFSGGGTLPNRRIRYFGPDCHVLALEAGDLRWFRSTSEDSPKARYGHAAVALDENSMFLFGGRGESGTFFDDSFEFTFHGDDRIRGTWKKMINTKNHPSPRSFAAMAATRDFVVLCGGCDAERCLDDLWLLNRLTKEWTRPLIAGRPPKARWGHALVPWIDGTLLVVGGSSAGPVDDHAVCEDDVMLGQAAQDLSAAYDLERLALHRAAHDLRHDLLEKKKKTGENPLRRRRHLDRLASQVAAGAARRETATKRMEDRALELLEAQRARDYAAKVRAQERSSIDADVVLDLQRLSWVSTLKKRSLVPSARVHFSACGLRGTDGRQRVVVVGGSAPSLASPSQPLRDAPGEYSVYVAESSSESSGLSWSMPAGASSVFEEDLSRARERRDRALKATRQLRDAARSLGVAEVHKNLRVIGADVELRCASEALRFIEEEATSEKKNNPEARFGAASALVGHRLFVHGGWLLSQPGQKVGLRATDELCALDLESPLERSRRKKREYYERLEQFRRDRDRSDAERAQDVAREAVLFSSRSAAAEAFERAIMAQEHIRSATPPLTTAPSVDLVKASATCIWLRWKPLTTDARGPRVEKKPTYCLYMRGGFRDFIKDDRVIIVCQKSSYEARILCNRLDGSFDVVYADRALRERKVDRKRLTHLKQQDWRLVYEGPEAHYAVEALVPQRILAKEPTLVVNCDFALKTRGADYRYDLKTQRAIRSHDEFSLLSEARTFWTRCANKHINDDDYKKKKALSPEIKAHGSSPATAEARTNN